MEENEVYFFLGKVKEMFCPSDVNTGFIQLVGPISQIDLNNITVKSYPLSISFAPRSTIPTLIGNRIDESTENTCTYKGNRFSLVDVQICTVTNKGYLLPGESKPPVAELILSFSANTPPTDLQGLSGILLCVPIYDSGTPNHAEYLTQLMEQTIPSCKYTNIVGSDYQGEDYQQIPNSTLSSCVKSCCGDVNCLAYTFRTGTCYLKNKIPELKPQNDSSLISGTVDHHTANKGATSSTCAKPISSNTSESSETKSNVATLESIFYAWSGDTSQSSLAYKTCFETIDTQQQPSSKSLYVVVFPNGIHLTQAGYQQLLLQMNGKLPVYNIPPAIRGGDATLQSYDMDEDGRKVPTILSKDGVIYATRMSSCADEFKNRMEYFTLPPRLPVTSSAQYRSDQCPYYKTTQYKCVPFDQMKDLSGNYVVPGNKTLETILYEQKQKSETQTKGGNKTTSMNTDVLETVVAVVAGAIIVGFVGLKIGSFVTNNLN